MRTGTGRASQARTGRARRGCRAAGRFQTAYAPDFFRQE